MHNYLCKIKMPGGQWITITIQATCYSMAQQICQGMYPSGDFISAYQVF